MVTNERTLSTLNKYGDLLLSNGDKFIIEVKDKTHIILYPQDDMLIMCHLLINGGSLNFATMNSDRPQIYVPCVDNKDLKIILENIEY